MPANPQLKRLHHVMWPSTISRFVMDVVVVEFVFGGIVVIAFASCTRGHKFEPRRLLKSFFLFFLSFICTLNSISVP